MIPSIPAGFEYACIGLFSGLLSAQALFNLYTLLYAWSSPDRVAQNYPAKKPLRPRNKFTVLLPARHEQAVIGETLRKLSETQYPKHLFELMLICHEDDTETIAAGQAAIAKYKITNARIEQTVGKPSKPKSLNYGLSIAEGNIIVIFDAEDDVHPDMLRVADTKFQQSGVDVLQCGVQLMNIHTKWYCLHNALEYYFWFKSRMHFFARVGMVPLGGNTVFFKAKAMRKAGGWNESFLTEDADIGLRLSVAGKKFGVLYSETHATREEAPDSVQQFVKQRTRWIQGFIQILDTPTWRHLPKVGQRLLAAYTLVMPFILPIVYCISPFLFMMSIDRKIPVALAMISYVPQGFLVLTLASQMIGLYEFGKNFGVRVPLKTYGVYLISFYPYQMLLSFSAWRAAWRELTGARNWEKTMHTGMHRIAEPITSPLGHE